MFTRNPFAELSAFISPAVMQAYVVMMIVLVVAGTLFDVVHKGSAKYFFENWRKSKSKGAKQIGGGEWRRSPSRPSLVDVLASGEFCNARRRVAHLLTMYGFLTYVITTADHGVRLPDARDPDARRPAAALVDRRPDGLPRRILVLVLHSGRCRRRGQFAVPRDAR